MAASALDDWLRDAGRDAMPRRQVVGGNGSEPSLDPFIRGAAAA